MQHRAHDRGYEVPGMGLCLDACLLVESTGLMHAAWALASVPCFESRARITRISALFSSRSTKVIPRPRVALLHNTLNNREQLDH